MAEAGFRIRGRVQGVGFRWWTRLQARELDLDGTVRNLADGSVEVQVWGSDAQIAELERRLGEGPAGGRVDAVQRVPCGSASRPRGFAILG